jgi:hypothetical protein
MFPPQIQFTNLQEQGCFDVYSAYHNIWFHALLNYKRLFSSSFRSIQPSLRLLADWSRLRQLRLSLRLLVWDSDIMDSDQIQQAKQQSCE